MTFENNSFRLFDQFSDLRVGIFGKENTPASDEEAAARLGFDRVSKLHQIHGDVIHIVKTIPFGFETQGDGLITREKNHALSARWADCQAFVMYAPGKEVLGVLHAGWRGMALKAITSFIKKLEKEYDVRPAELFIGVTPSLCKECADFSDPLKELPAHLHRFVNAKKVDLQAAADTELDTLGVPQKQRERHPACTKCGEGFWSYRRDRGNVRNYLIAGMIEDGVML